MRDTNGTQTRLGERLRGLRELQGWTVAEAAGACGVTEVTWRAWEAGTNEPTVRMLRKVAAGLSTTMSRLLAGVE